MPRLSIRFERQREVVCIQLETLAKVEPMRSVTCVAGVQMDTLALVGLRMVN